MARLAAMERDHKAAIEALEAQYQLQLLQQAQGPVPPIDPPASPPLPVPKRARGETEDTDFIRDTRAILGILFAKVRIKSGDVLEFRLARLNRDFEDAIKMDSKVLNANWDRVHSSTRADMRRNQHYLATAASDQFTCSSVLMKKVCSGSIYSKPFGQLGSMDDLKHNWALPHFAPEEHSTDLLSFKARLQAEEDDVLFDQPILHATKKETNLFIQGSFDVSVDALLSTVANFLVFAQTVVDVPEWGDSPHNPAIVNYMHRLTDLLCGSEHKRAINLLQKDAPYILFTIFSGFQDVSFHSISDSSVIVLMNLGSIATRASASDRCIAISAAD